MSHFTLTVRVTAERLKKHEGDLDAALDDMLAPFCEQTEDDRFRTFCDEEDEEREKYATGSVEMWRSPSGEDFFPWDRRFKGPGFFDEAVMPADHAVVTVTHKDKYPTFEAFMADWVGAEGPDEKTGRYGHWRNPNAKWDWHVVGGRWHGFCPVKGEPVLGESGSGDNKPKPGHGDIVKLADINMDAVATEAVMRADTFFGEYQQLLAGQRFGAFEGPRDKALDLGLVTISRGPAEATGDTIVLAWKDAYPKIEGERAGWNDVCRKIDRATFDAEFAANFNPLLTYAVLDDDGWHASGDMGWWGCSSDKPDDKVSFQRAFVDRFVKTTGPDDLLVVVDCHI